MSYMDAPSPPCKPHSWKQQKDKDCLVKLSCICCKQSLGAHRATGLGTQKRGPKVLREFSFRVKGTTKHGFLMKASTSIKPSSRTGTCIGNIMYKTIKWPTCYRNSKEPQNQWKPDRLLERYDWRYHASLVPHEAIF